MTKPQPIFVLVFAYKIAPLLPQVGSIVNNAVACCKLRAEVKDLLGLSVVVDVEMVHAELADYSQLGFCDPSPKSYMFLDFNLLDFGLAIQVEDLNDGFRTMSCSQHYYILRSVHEDSLGRHGLALEKKVFRGVDDRAICFLLYANVLL